MTAWQRMELQNPVYSIAERIQRARAAGLSDQEIAAALGVSVQQLQKAFVPSSASSSSAASDAAGGVLLVLLLLAFMR